MKALHRYQMEILKILLFKPASKFSDLNLSGLTSDHLTYHMKGLVNAKLVTKDEKGLYTLTPKGKEHANTMDTDKIAIEKQPKVAVMLIIEKEIEGEIHLLIQTRLKEPYFGYKGFPTGKVRYGEKLYEAAARELKEEVDLKAQFELKFILHELVYSKEGALLEDKIFHVIKGINPTGKIRDFDGGKNEWLKWDQYLSIENRFKDDDVIFSTYNNPVGGFYQEKTYTAEEF